MQNTHHVFIVDDDELLSSSLQMALETKGYKVEALNSGEKAVEIILEKKPDMILLDIMLPGKTGVEILKELQAKDPSWSDRIIMMTSLNDYKLLDQALHYGVKSYVEKSETNPEAVVEIVDRKLGQKNKTE